jgi:hypothetical protein
VQTVREQIDDGEDHSAMISTPKTGQAMSDRVIEPHTMCAPSPIRPNIYANSTGYQVIAVAFQQVIESLG